MSKLLKNFAIHEFRGMKDLFLYDLGDINVFSGTNDSGKTSVLEALAIYAKPMDVYEWVNTSRRRELGWASSVESVKWLFPQSRLMKGREFDKTYRGSISLEGDEKFSEKKVNASFEDIFRLSNNEDGNEDDENERGAKLSIKIQTMPSHSVTEHFFEIWDTKNEPYPKTKYMSLPMSIITPLTHRMNLYGDLTDVIKKKNKEDVLEVLKMFDKGIRDISILFPQGHSVIEIEHVDFNTTIPISAFGDGLRRALSFALHVHKSSGGILLVDDIDLSIHSSLFPDLYQWLLNSCKNKGIQLFVTVHSKESLELLFHQKTELDMSIYRVENKV